MKKLIFVVMLSAFPLFALAEYDLTDDVFDEVKYEKSPRAEYTLGLMYLQGQGVAKNNKQALSWLKKSAEQGYSLALHRLGRIYLNDDVVKADPKVAIEYITAAATKGYSPAQHILGTFYQTGSQGVTENKKTAMKWFRLAADQDHKAAKLALAAMASEEVSGPSTGPQFAFTEGMKFLKGKGVDRDYQQAAEWFSRAAEQGHADAQYNLGELYNKGRGVKRNKKIAQKWYKAAAEQGHVKAKYRTKGCAFC
jgi:uncharacterized protein